MLVNLLIVFVFVMSLLIIYYMSSKMNKTLCHCIVYTSNTSVRDETQYDMLRLKRKSVSRLTHVNDRNVAKI